LPKIEIDERLSAASAGVAASVATARARTACLKFKWGLQVIVEVVTATAACQL